MKNLMFRVMKLAAAGSIALLATAAPADELTRDNLQGAGVPATGWYPAEVIERRGMDRYPEAWKLEPCMNGEISPTGAYASSEEEEALKDSVADTREIDGSRDALASPAGGDRKNPRR